MDVAGQFLWFLMFATPLITIPLVWRYSKQRYIIRLLVALLLAGILSALLYLISLEIIFRDGMGPV